MAVVDVCVENCSLQLLAACCLTLVSLSGWLVLLFRDLHDRFVISCFGQCLAICQAAGVNCAVTPVNENWKEQPKLV